MGSKVLLTDPLLAIDNAPMGEHRHKNPSGLCCPLIRGHGNPLLWRMVPAIPQLLGRANAQCTV